LAVIWDYIIKLLITILNSISQNVDSYGLGLIIFALISRIILSPLTIVQLLNSFKTKELRPLLKEIDSNYNIKNLTQEERLERRLNRRKLLETSGVRPFTLGCLPFLIQIPVIIIAYQVIVNNKEMLSHTFLWFNLGKVDPFFILPLLAGLACYLQTTQQNVNQLKLSVILSIIIFIVALIVPAFVSVYIITVNLYSIFLYSLIIFFTSKKFKKNESFI